MSTAETEVFTSRLASLRAKSGLSQAQLAQAVGVSATTIGYWESGKHEPIASKLFKLAEALSTTRDYLIGETSDPAPDSFTQLRREMGDQLRPRSEDRAKRDGRPSALLHPKSYEKAEVLADKMECLTVDEVVAKLINDKFDEFFPGENPPQKHETREVEPAPSLHEKAMRRHEEAMAKLERDMKAMKSRFKKKFEDDDDEEYDIDMTK